MGMVIMTNQFMRNFKTVMLMQKMVVVGGGVWEELDKEAEALASKHGKIYTLSIHGMALCVYRYAHLCKCM